MTKALFAVAAFISAAIGMADVAVSAEIRVLGALAFRPSLNDLTAEFERTSGHKLIFAYGSAGAVRDRILGGEAADIALSSKPMIEALIASGKIPKGATVSLAQSLVAVAIRAGSPKPDMNSIDAFRRPTLPA